MQDEKELIKIGIEYLSKNIRFRDIYISPLNKPVSNCPAAEYSNYEMRVIRRTLDFISRSKENLQWLHDFLISEKLDKDTFTVFFKIWSKEYRKCRQLI